MPLPAFATDDLAALVRLVAAAGASEPRRRLLAACATPAAALAAGPRAWRERGLSEAQVAALLAPDPAALARAADWLDEPGHQVIGWGEPDYPSLLARSASPPLALFVAGDAALLWHPCVAVVGSRTPTPGGRDNAAMFARVLATSGLGVASGLAAGIDAAAHQAALVSAGVTVAVLGTGPDIAYPSSNAALHARIARAGAIVSEHLPGTTPRPEQFPSRNRILAGLTLGTVVIEAAERSGALITARLAAEAGREVFAVPGSIHNPLARGCHRLLRDGATLVEDAAEVLAALAPMAQELAADLRMRLSTEPAMASHPRAGDGSAGAAAESAAAAPRNDADYQSLWKALGHDPTDMDQLVERTRLTPAHLSSMLLLMELDGRVAMRHGRYYRTG